MVLLLCLAGKYCAGQQSATDLEQEVRILCDSFDGRGYVANGSGKAAAYLSGLFRFYGLTPFNKQQSYLLNYSFPVNTFPDSMQVIINGRTLAPGIDYLVHPASNGIHVKDIPVGYADALTGNLPAASHKAHFILNLDSLLRREGRTERQWLDRQTRGIYLVPRNSKPLWWVATDTASSTVIYLYDTALLNQDIKSISVNINNRLIREYPAANIAGYIPGTQFPDSFLVITAHYDHLGKMGEHAVFPGASDNASGTSMLLSLARYYKQHPLKYSVAFLLFSGEEAGLLGSSYYVQHPLFPLENIRFLLNMDIMGDASGGITVVNGSIHREEFDLLQKINKELPDPLPGINMRGTAANSDHYPFSEAGVPAIFIYSNGGKGFYHDVWDRPESLSYENVPALRQLLITFINRLAHPHK